MWYPVSTPLSDVVSLLTLVHRGSLRHWQTDPVASAETRTAPGAVGRCQASAPSSQTFLSLSLFLTIFPSQAALRFLRASSSDASPSPFEPARVSLLNEERSASFLGATSRCILQLHAPSCLQLGVGVGAVVVGGKLLSAATLPRRLRVLNFKRGPALNWPIQGWLTGWRAVRGAAASVLF